MQEGSPSGSERVSEAPLAQDLTPPVAHLQVPKQQAGTAAAGRQLHSIIPKTQSSATGAEKQHEGKGMAGLSTCGFHPEDDEAGTLQLLGEQFCLLYAL